MAYPQDPVQVAVFYNESERLVRFLSAADKRGFGALLRGDVERATVSRRRWTKGFGARFINLEALEREFKTYATHENGALCKTDRALTR